MTTNERLARRLVLTHCPDGWWVTSRDGEIDMGPYATRREAIEARQGVQKFLRNEHRRGFVTSGR